MAERLRSDQRTGPRKDPEEVHEGALRDERQRDQQGHRSVHPRPRILEETEAEAREGRLVHVLHRGLYGLEQEQVQADVGPPEHGDAAQGRHVHLVFRGHVHHHDLHRYVLPLRSSFGWPPRL